MSAYKQAFPGRHALLAVIHVLNGTQARENVRVALGEGMDGTFLISHGEVREETVIDLAHQAGRDSWAGVNCLGITPRGVFRLLPPEVSGMWADDAGVDEREEEQPEAEAVTAAREESGWRGLYFGGVAFKYQREVDRERLEKAASIAARHMDVVTTSGPGTGEAAEVGKISAMRRGLGDVPLAIASGITPENVAEYLPFADCFLVATGISKDFHSLDPARVAALVREVR
jgi:hypothetical protein